MMSVSKRSKLMASTALWPLYRGFPSTVMAPETFDIVGRCHIRFVAAVALQQQLVAEANGVAAA
jgi:hypothetical protein